MNYRSKHNNYNFIHDDNLLETLLNDRGVSDVETFLNLSEDVIHDPRGFRYMRSALAKYKKHVLKKKVKTSNIHVVVDSDTDGMTSAANFIMYTQDVCQHLGISANVSWNLHPNKEHGIILKELPLGIDLLVVPDAGSNDVKECKELSEMGVDILILDHHNIDIKNPYATVINCQDGKYPNNTLSGVGVVYKFTKVVDDFLGTDFADKYLDLFAVGVIGDRMDLRNFETRYLALKGIENFGSSSDLLVEMAERQAFSINGNLNITKVGWFIAPLFNGVIRSGTFEEKRNVFRALIGERESVEYQPRRKKKTDPKPDIEIQTLQKAMARESANIKGRQDREVKKGMTELEKQIEREGLNEGKLLIVDGSADLDQTFTGLAANKFASKYNKPTLILRDATRYKPEYLALLEYSKKLNDVLSRIDDPSMGEEVEEVKSEFTSLIASMKPEKVYGGSGRNFNDSPIESLQDFLLNLGLFDKVQGHDNAFGIGIKANNLDELKEAAEKALEHVKMENIYTVDYEIPVGRLKAKHVEEVGQWTDVWGNLLDEPLFAITDIYMPTDKIQLMGTRKNVIKFELRDLTFVKKHANEEIYNHMIMRTSKGLSKKSVSKVKIDLIGKFKINEFEGKSYPQIEIVDYVVSENNEIVF